jgi:preprotein translocase SecE subunit
VSYRKNEGRYARMVAFWVLALLIGYGFFSGGGLNDLLGLWGASWDQALVEPFPLLGALKYSSLVSIALYGVLLLTLSRILNRHKLADLLIDTEGEMKKVTWPGWSEVAQGTMAVTAMVVVLFAFLTVVDLLLAKGIGMLLSSGAGS